MTTELLIILELVLVIIALIVLGVAIWRAQSKHIKELEELNQALVGQMDDIQEVLDEKKATQETMTQEFEELGEAVDIQVNNTLDYANANISDMSRLVMEHMKLLNDTDYFLSQGKPDIESARKEIEKLKGLLGITEKTIVENKTKLKDAEGNIKKMKAKMRDLSKQIQTLNSLEVSESRLKRDKTRLLERIEKLKDKHDSQKVIERNLQNELKTSYRASEVNAMREELKNTEDQLRRTMVEKLFIEQHFLELASQEDPEKISHELKRVKREMKQLEKGFLDLQEDK